MQIGLTGASGFVGRQVVRAALRRGHEVVAFTRNPSHTVPDCIETRRFSLDAAPDFSGCEAIIHLAGENVAGWWSAAKMRRIRESRVMGTQRVVEGIRAGSGRPEVLVCASGSGFYGDGGEAELTEGSAAGAGFLAEVCQAWEREARAAEPLCRVVSTRFGLVLGRDGGALQAMVPLYRFGLGGRIGSGRQWWSWIHRDDVASLLLFAVENMDLRGPVNGVSPWPVRNADFSATLARVLRRPAIFPAPAWALRLMLRGFACELLDSRRVLPASATQAGFPFQFSELEPALRDLLH